MACVFKRLLSQPNNKSCIRDVVSIVFFFLHEAATRFSTRLSTHMMSEFTDSLQG